MPFSFHDKPKPSDKYRGKTRDEFLDGVRDKFDQEKKMFFEKGPPWESMPSTTAGFSRGGFFDDDMMSRGGRGDIRSHLDDLAHRHPEFASQLRGPAWGEEMWKGDEEGASGSQASSNSEPRQDEEHIDEPGPLRGRPRTNHLPQHGLRNTVPDMGQRQADELKEEARGQRSWSAPPDNRLPREQQRFVSRIDINPVNPEDQHTQAPDNQGKPPPVPKQPQQQPPQQPKSAGNVRHIPIFVEGRDEPILPKNLDGDPEPASHQQNFTSQTQHQFQPQKRPFQSAQSNPSSQHKQPNRSFDMQPQEGSPEPPRPPTVVNDPISRVAAIQGEVSALREQVERFSGSSRREKEYVYLDEMLTRNLIKLDDIETEGRENIRVARKDAIRCIQQCIATLEAKVPTDRPAEELAGDAVSETTDCPPCPDQASPMDVQSAAPSPSNTLEEQPKD